jgi:hypothetical protein
MSQDNASLSPGSVKPYGRAQSPQFDVERFNKASPRYDTNLGSSPWRHEVLPRAQGIHKLSWRRKR